jgi:DNA-binding NtrC family response regulator
MSERSHFALVPKPPSLLERAEPGAKRILTGMVADALALAKKKTPKPRGKLLIVDDEDLVRQSMRVIFEGEYDLFLAGDGLTAIELAKLNDIDVVVTNINMPGMSGIELLERLKFMKPDIEVIMMTGFETTDTLRQSLRLGACDYINKPFDVPTMRAAISKAMQHRTLEREITAARKQSSSSMEKVANLTLQTLPPRIVQLDDDIELSETYRVVLQSWYEGGVVVQCAGGDEAWEALSRANPDLFITDIHHPGMSCPEMLAGLAQRKVNYPILVISGGVSMYGEDMRRSWGLGLNVSFLQKPVYLETFRTAVEAALRVPLRRAR